MIAKIRWRKFFKLCSLEEKKLQFFYFWCKSIDIAAMTLSNKVWRYAKEKKIDQLIKLFSFLILYFVIN